MHTFLRKEKRYWRKWHQPILTANGTMGGDSFAVSSNVNSVSGRELWKAFDGNSNNDYRWQSVSTNGTVTFDFYNPQPLKLHSLVLNYGNGESYYYPKEVIIQGSDDGNSWTDLTTFTNNAYAASFNIQINSSSGYKYHRLKFVSFNGYNSGNMYVMIRELIITADYYDEHWGYKTYNIMKKYIKHHLGDFNPKNVLVIGSPAITEQGVVSGFSTANYIRPTAFKPESSPWEMMFKVTTGENVTTEQCIFGVEDITNQRAGFGMSVHNGFFSIRLMTASSDASWTFTGDGTIAVQPNTTYKLKASWNGNTYYLQVMEEGASTYITDISYTSSSPIYRISNENEDTIGVMMRNSSTIYPFWGSIDLSESYMKVNGEYYWTGFYTSDVIGYKTYNVVDQSKEIITQQFDYTGALQTFTVPDGVTSIQVDCVGASGANGVQSTGGKGGRVKTILSVTPNQQLKIWVGKVPEDNPIAEYNASDIRTSSAAITSEEGLNSRLIIAGGGGNGTHVNWIDGNGGNGGGLVGGSATDGYGTNATGGTQNAGGTMGKLGALYGSTAGENGKFALGGDGGKYNGSNWGGAGGAGYYGGGSGGSGLGSPQTGVIDGLAGAGGSSYTDPTLCSNVSHVQGVQSGDGYVKISYKVRRTANG